MNELRHIKQTINEYLQSLKISFRGSHNDYLIDDISDNIGCILGKRHYYKNNGCDDLCDVCKRNRSDYIHFQHTEDYPF